MPHISNIPVKGEHVVVTEYNGQHYYTSIINRKSSINENAIPGASGTYEKNTNFCSKILKSLIVVINFIYNPRHEDRGATLFYIRKIENAAGDPIFSSFQIL